VYVFTAVLIIACPCALALSAPFTFGNTMRIFGRKGLYIKNSGVIERLSHINTIVFDKTGTLTQPNETFVEYTGREIMQEEKNTIYSLSRQSPHPLSMAMTSYLEECEYSAPDHFVEVEGRGVFGRVNGYAIRYGSEEFVSGNDGAKIIYPSARDDSTRSSLVDVSINGSFAGTFRISNKYRENIGKVIQSLHKRYELYLLSGDNSSEEENLKNYFRPGHLHFNQKPQDKSIFVKRLQQEGKIVLMTGDGLNDAGALMQSNVALTIANKAYQFSPASDAVLEAGKFGLLGKFISFSNTARRIVHFSFAISSIYNLIGIGIALSGSMSPVIAAILMPASSVSAVAFATFATRIAGRIKLK
jgi:Cu+-exporting ATPase